MYYLLWTTTEGISRSIARYATEAEAKQAASDAWEMLLSRGADVSYVLACCVERD